MTSPIETFGETPLAVVIRPKTSQGWRPTSVKIQPKLLAKTGRSGAATAAYANHLDVGVRPLRVSHRTASAMSAVTMPSPIMRRNDQQVVGMLGTYAALRSLMPLTAPLKSPVAGKLSRPGTAMMALACEPSSEPTVSTEKGAPTPPGTES